ncbi:MAG: L-seryl-tRNA(Sec) selenium transferase [Planctomycetota bacterium]
MCSKKRGDTLQGLIPSVDRVLEEPALAALAADLDRAFVVARVREVLEEHRGRLKTSAAATLSAADAAADAAGRIRGLLAPGMCRVVNATGTILHTGLGRAVLPPAARAALNDALAGYCFVQTDQNGNDRVERERFIAGLFQALTGAETAVVINNNAAAVFLLLKVLAAGREVIISRGELVEIGGSFRIPDVMHQSGARLVEVGTTNRTRAEDYRRAITPATAALMVVHQSNYRIEGFTGAPELKELADLAHEHKLLLIHDLGSGMMYDLPGTLTADEPVIGASLAAGADVLALSGDKLLGGPQAGIILGREALLAPLRKDPFFRMLRPCKLTYVALEATLALYARDRAATIRAIPALDMFHRPLAAVAAAADDLAAFIRTLPGLTAEVVDESGTSGGGALAAVPIPTRAVAVRHASLPVQELARRLRTLPVPPVLARVSADRVIIDPRTLLDGEAALVKAAFRAVAQEGRT